MKITSLWVCILFLCSGSVTALELGEIKDSYYKGDYGQTIIKGENSLAQFRGSEPGLDELYYMLGVSYLKEGNILRAQDIFSVILEEFQESRYLEDTRVQLRLAQSKWEDVAELKERISKWDFEPGYFTIQVGSFSNPNNARNLCNKLLYGGYEAYVVETLLDGEHISRVRTGRFLRKEDAEEAKQILSKEKYSVTICPFLH